MNKQEQEEENLKIPAPLRHIFLQTEIQMAKPHTFTLLFHNTQKNNKSNPLQSS